MKAATRRDRAKEDPSFYQKAGRWGHEKGWQWVNREDLDRRCMKHRRVLVRREFHGRRVVVVQDNQCRMRAVVKRSRRDFAKVTEP